jgi:hypothetical protein
MPVAGLLKLFQPLPEAGLKLADWDLTIFFELEKVSLKLRIN